MTSNTLQNMLLAFGIIAPLIYVSTDLIAGTLLSGYNFIMQSASKLPSIGSPVSGFVLPFHFVYYLLMIAFGVVVWQLSGGRYIVEIVSALMIGNAVVSFVSDAFFRVNYSANINVTSDKVNVILGATGMIFVIVAIMCGAIGFTNWFRYDSIGTLVVFLVLSFLGLMSSPHIGIQERTMIWGYGAWVVLLAINLLRE